VKGSVRVRHLGRGQPIANLSLFGISQRRSTRVQHSNSRSHELRVVLALSPSQWLCVKVLARRSHTHITSRVSEFGERGVKGLRLMNSRVVRGSCAKARLWSHGDVRLTPGVKLCRAGFHGGLIDCVI
jgi:hypothetical protein